MEQLPPHLPSLPEQDLGYMDFFSDENSNNKPVILEDGTSVLFPKDWTDEDADKWRKGMDLQKPDYSIGHSHHFH
jgi:hypothetical protein